MKQLFYLLIFLFLASSCTYKLYYVKPNYALQQVNKKKVNSQHFKDSLISVELIYAENWYDLKLENISDDNIFIVWDEMSFGLNGNVGPIMNKDVELFQKGQTIKPTIVPPGSVRLDQIIPVENIHTTIEGETISSLDEGLVTSYFSLAKKYVDEEKEHTIYLAIKHKDKMKYYLFDFNRIAIVKDNGGKYERSITSSNATNRSLTEPNVYPSVSNIIVIFISFISVYLVYKNGQI